MDRGGDYAATNNQLHVRTDLGRQTKLVGKEATRVPQLLISESRRLISSAISPAFISAASLEASLTLLNRNPKR